MWQFLSDEVCAFGVEVEVWVIDVEFRVLNVEV
jgi:hypothetical protein